VAVLKHAWPYVDSVEERREYTEEVRDDDPFVEDYIYGTCYSYSLCVILPLSIGVISLLILVVIYTHCWYEADRRVNRVKAPAAYSATRRADQHISSRREIELVTQEVLPPQMRTGKRIAMQADLQEDYHDVVNRQGGSMRYERREVQRL
jgi:hypothetical protein